MLDEILVLRDQHFLDQVGMTQKQNSAGTEAQTDHIAIVAGAGLEEFQAPEPKSRQIAAQPMAAWAGCENCCCHRSVCLSRHCLLNRTFVIVLKGYGLF